MPRVTRAALRLNAMLEETNLAASTPLPSTPVPLRAPLGEITGNSEEVKSMVSNLEELVKAQKKAPPKGKRGKVPHSERKLVSNARREEEIIEVEIVEDDNQSATSSAVEEACQDLMRESSGGNSITRSVLSFRPLTMNVGRSEICQVIIHDKRPHTPPSPAVTMVKRSLSIKANLPKADATVSLSTTTALPAIQKNENMASILVTTETDDFPLDQPKTLPKIQQTEVQATLPAIATATATDGKDDFPLDQIMAPSPTKPITRIEDSVEAIDAFEDAIEKVGELIPAIPEGPRSPKKAIKAGNASHISNDDNKTGSNGSELTAPTKAARPSNTESRKMTTRATSKTGTPAKPKRISSIHRAPFQPTKSTKPPTRSTFELPGEAVARKLKEQREARLKREEVGPTKKPVFRSRPVRLSQAPVVKQTTTSNARLSLAKADFKKASPLRQRVSVDSNKRLSTLSQAKGTRPSLSKKTTGPVSLRSSIIGSTPHAPGVSGTSRPAIAASDAAQLKLRGKEVFNRNRIELDERERARKEKEEAARKARAEAAERGRIASREWAEKQRMKKLAIEKGQGDRPGN